MGDYHINVGKISEGFYFIDESLKIYKEQPLHVSKLLNSFYKEDLDLDNYYNDIDKLKKFYNVNNKIKLENKCCLFDKQIKIGFVSADFRTHAVSFQILDVIKTVEKAISEQNPELAAEEKKALITKAVRATLEKLGHPKALDEEAIIKMIESVLK
jgi:predicted O-linked N-acetylglucosamine transferase (SPINDLY family)